jgi:S-adenosylmethionine:tRNA ribosyltransferase-isomerase
MKTENFYFDLPRHLIAQEPSPFRGGDKLMLLNRNNKSVSHHLMPALPDLLPPESLLVFNNSRVRKARLFGNDIQTNRSTEFLLVRQADAFSWTVLTKHLKRRRTGSRYYFSGNIEAAITNEDNEFRTLTFSTPIDDEWLDIHGHVPLPPYIKRADAGLDEERYQTVYAQKHGSVAAPTAGLHFTEEMLQSIRGKGIDTVFITLHVGLGTFIPVRTESVEDHVMHEEAFTIDDESAHRIERARNEGRPITAIGTTSVRTLESAWDGTQIRRGNQATSIFIYPPYQFKVVNSIFTNFHTPASTLLMLVCAFAGRDFILQSYQQAVRSGYRFFSYGDAMLIL